MVSIREKNMLYISYTSDANDQNPQCTWAVFVIDPDDMSLTIRSDGGNMAYTWQNIGDNTPKGFLKFLAGLDEEYLLCKLSEKSKFNFDKTREKLLKYLPDKYDGPIDELKAAQPFCDANEFAAWYLSLPYTESDDLECIEMDYPAGHRAAVEIFTKYVQPKLREML